MADKENSNTQIDTPADKKTEQSAPARPVKKAGKSGSSKVFVLLLALLILLAVVLGGALYYQNQQYLQLKQELQDISVSNTDTIQKSQQDAATALARAEQQQKTIDSLAQSLDTAKKQLQELDQALQLVTDSGSDLLLLNDIDHLVTVAQQQLSLGGNVANAIITLETAQAQLARANRQAFVSLQQSINGDIDKLRSVATINLSALSAKVDDLVVLLGSAPLLVPDDVNSANNISGPDAEYNISAAEPIEEPLNSTEYWTKLSKRLWQQTKDLSLGISQDLKQFFDIRKVDDQAALLMTPDQARRLRETLTQRAITAQLALMMQQTKIWHEELDKIAQAIDKRFDMHAQDSRKALSLARDLYDTAITIDLPDLENSLSAIAAVRDELSARDLEVEQPGADLN